MADLRSRSYARILDLICEGEIGGLVDGAKSIYLDGTPIQNAGSGSLNFTDVQYETRNGTNNQTYIAGIPAVENETALSLEVTQSTPLVQTISNSDVDAVRIRFVLPSLFFQNSKGDLEGQTVRLKVEVQPSGGSYAEVSLPGTTFSGKTTGEYQRSVLVPLTGSAPWNIRVSRITDDSTNIRLSNKTYWDAYTEIIDAKLRYPNAALVNIKFNSEYFQGIPTRSYDVKLLKVKVPSNYNPVTRAYTGIWDGTFKTAKEWTDNPAWCFYDLLTSARYGLGQYVDEDQIDKWGLYTIARYCDELVSDGFGGTEPRFTCNMYLQSRKEAFNVIQDLSSIFRGMVYWSAGQITVTQDAPSDPVAIFNAANVIDGLFTYQGSSSKARHTVALVTWNDPDDNYKQKVEYVEDTVGIIRYGVVETQVVAIGCTSRGQANRVGRWLLYSEQSETETVQFKTGIEGAVCRPGQIIAVSDSVRGGIRRGGRVVAATTTTITIDAPVALSGIGHTLSVILPTGAVETRGIGSVASTNINVDTAFSVAPAAGAVWIIESPNLQSQLFRVISVAEAEEAFEINALAHNPDKFDAIEDGLVLQPRSISILDEAPAAPASAAATETLYTYNDEIRVRVDLGWEKVQPVKYYVVQSQKDDGTVSQNDVYDSDFELLNVTPGVFTFRVYSVGVTGKLSTDYAETTITVLGKTAPPADVPGLSHVLDPNLGVTLTWNRVADLDLDAYEVRQGSTWGASSLVGQVKGTTLKVGLLTSGTTTYLIKALDTSGNYSTNAVSTAVMIVTAAAPVVASSFVGQNIVLTWGAVQGSLATDAYDIRYGASFAAGVSLGTIKGTTFSAKANWSGSRTFWVAAIDLNGNTGTAGSVNAVVTIPSAVSITQEVIDNNVLLKWGDATQTLPVDYYELRKGATFAGSTVIGRISARFTAIFEASGGTYSYWITGVDIAGNVGAEAAVTAFVNQPPDYQLQYDANTVFAGTKSNMVANSEGTLNFVLPVDTSKTWETHFTSKSWTTPQAQITAGFPYYAQPTAASGFYEETIDYGTVLAATKITVTPTYSTLTGTPSVQVTLSVKKLVGDPWTDYPNTTSVFVTDFRYVKFKITATSTGEDDLIVLSGVNVRFDVKLKNDAGTASAVSTDSGGTQVNFNLPFVDVSSITVTPLSTSAIIAVYDFVDVPNPTGFKVLLFNTSGTRVSGTVSWSAKGV